MHTQVDERDRSRRAELQRLIGDAGVILERQKRGTPERPAAGWYARLGTGELVFLGDHTLLAVRTIDSLTSSNGA
jgi:hypothetical protein